MIWTQTLRGRAFDLINPTPDMVDFAEIADQLAQINRYAGAAEKPVSVALHTLIVADACLEAGGDPSDVPYALLHDAHEAFIGDIITPTAHALAALADPYNAGVAVKRAIAELKHRIDLAIYAAADLAPPDAPRLQRIRVADLRALLTERRDFLSKPPRPWAPEIEALKPLAKQYRLHGGYGAALDVGDVLHKKFKTYLPALKRRAA